MSSTEDDRTSRGNHQRPEPPPVVQTHGYIPRLWEGRNVVFFANLLSLFYGNEEEGQALAHEISGAECYGGRLLPLIGLLFKGGTNLLLLERAPDPALTAYFADGLNLDLPEVKVLSHEDYLLLGQSAGQRGLGSEPPASEAQRLREELLSFLRTHPADWVDAYVTDATIESLAADLGMQAICRAGGSYRGNHKRLFHQHMEGLGHPTFTTKMAAGQSDVGPCLEQLSAEGYKKAAIKSAIGASGIGLMATATSGEVPEVPEYFFYEGDCMVQGWLEPGRRGIDHIKSPSVQLFLDDERVYLYDLTEQILSEASIHQGNESPPPYVDRLPDLANELFAQASDAGSWLHQQGYRGTASVDFLVAFHGMAGEGGYMVYPCEINARVTGATYPSVLARHFLPRGGWLMRNLRLSSPASGQEILQMLDRNGHLFRPGARAGVLPINFNLDADGLIHKGQFLCLGETPEECQQLLAAADRDLPLLWGDIDRD